MEYQEIPKELERMQSRTYRAGAELHQHLSNYVNDSRNLRSEIAVDGCCYLVTYDEKTAILDMLVKGGKERIEQLKILNAELQGMWEKLNAKR
ncbi:hypothetical protein [Escherichia phage Ecp_YSF]|nr:hypothetical protein [Escherichia phage Ecp_YSF]